MPRRKLSELRAKQLVCGALEIPYRGWAIDTTLPFAPQLPPHEGADLTYAVKVDQGVKGRFKAGLVLLHVSHAGIAAAAQQLAHKGYQHLIVEPMLTGSAHGERYLSLTRGRDGVVLAYNQQGGVNVESHADTMRTILLTDATDWQYVARDTGLSEPQLRSLLDIFTAQHITFLEINPYVVRPYGIRLLDLAIEVDDAAAFFADDWTPADFREARGNSTSEEQAVQQLGEKSPASFKLDVLNPDGSVFLLLSGGGASIVVADEVHNLGFGAQLANYGEYSGNPNAEETYQYTAAVLSLLIKSKAPRKVLFVGGAVANFTDIANTFTGVIRAIDDVADELKAQQVKVFVRRGGPRQEIGLAKIEAALARHGLLGGVHSPATPLVRVVADALKELQP